MKLYGFPASPNTWKVRALAAQLKMPLEFELVDLLKGAQQTPAFLALNPTGRTPVLVDGDFKLWESNAILQYLASKNPTPLYPNDAKGRADVSRWQFWDLAHWGAQACQPLTFENSGQEIRQSRRSRPGRGRQGYRGLHQGSQDAGRASGAAQISRQRYADDRRLHRGGAAVSCARRRNTGRTLCQHRRLVRPRVGAAVLERDRTANGSGSLRRSFPSAGRGPSGTCLSLLRPDFR